MVESLRKKQPDLKRRRIQRDKNPASVPPSGAPSWCLNHEALKQFNRSSDNVPVFDYDTDEDNTDNNNIDDDDEEAPNPDRRKKRKKKSKKKRNSKKHK